MPLTCCPIISFCVRPQTKTKTLSQLLKVKTLSTMRVFFFFVKKGYANGEIPPFFNCIFRPSISRKENAISPHFEFLPNFSGRNLKKLFLPGGKNSKNHGKNTFFSTLEETGEPCIATLFESVSYIFAKAISKEIVAIPIVCVIQ